MYIDTHTHISNNFGIKPDIYVNNAKNVDVDYLIVSCCDKDSILEGLELINEFKNIFLVVGYHPDEVENIDDEDILYLERIIMSHRNKIVGIGEIGLDYHYVKDKKNEQKKLFVNQLNLAQKLNLPVVIHSRDAIEETYEILSTYRLKGDIHCFSGSIEMASKFIRLGYYLGIGGVLTFKNSKLFQVVEKFGIEHIVLETDSPYLSPIRGEINESKNIPIIADNVARILNCSVELVQNKTTSNAIELFDLDIVL